MRQPLSTPPSYLFLLVGFALLFSSTGSAQNSMIGDGFGGRLWYTPYNYTVGSYSAYTICGDPCGNQAQLYGWGGNYYYQLGDGTNVSTTPPVAALNMTDVKFYTTGYCMAVIKNDNTGWAWGKPFQLPPIATAPMQVLTDVKFADAGTYLCSFVKNDGTVWSVGSNGTGSFGNGSKDPNTTSAPSQMVGINNAVRVSVTQLTIAVLLKDGTVMATGQNARGGLGNNSTLITEALTPVRVTGLSNIIDIKGNEGTNIALDKNGDVYAWGSNGWNAIGDGGPGGPSDNRLVPVKVPGLNNIVAISGCDDGIHFLALDANHNCYGWGFSAYGQIGQGGPPRVATPMLVATNVDDIMAGETFSYIVKTDGTLWATGGSPSQYYVTMPGSIYMNIPDVERNVFTQIDPTIPPMNLCRPVKIFTIGAETPGCGTIKVDVGGGTAPFQYDIGGPPQASNIFTGVAPGTYTVTVTDAAGCTRQTTAIVTMGNGISNAAVTKTDPSCGKNNGAINFGNITGGTPPYTYSVDASPFTSTTSYSNLAAGNHIVSVNDAAGCSYSKTINLQDQTVLPSIADAGPDQDIISSSTILNANQPAQGSGAWTIISGSGSLTNPGQYNSMIGNMQVGVTKLRWTISNSCGSSSDTMTITVRFGKGDIYVPTAFTPNNNGLNDRFGFIANAGINVTMFKVYDCWGLLVHDFIREKRKWDGTYKGESQTNGVYAWILEAIDENGKKINMRGLVTLIR